MTDVWSRVCVRAFGPTTAKTCNLSHVCPLLSSELCEEKLCGDRKRSADIFLFLVLARLLAFHVLKVHSHAPNHQTFSTTVVSQL